MRMDDEEYLMAPQPPVAPFLPLLLATALFGCGSSNRPPVDCPQLKCKVTCGPAGTRKDDHTGCDTCLCAGTAAPDAGAACPAIECMGSCGLGQAKDPLTGCDTCGCCNPADCIDPGACHGTGADGCPTCYLCH
jgi:hypothetical protein